MKKDGILNPNLIAAISALGHTEYLVIADAGLPLAGNPAVIDLSLTRHVPSFMDVLEAVSAELVTESFIVAEEMEGTSEDLYRQARAVLRGIPQKTVSHERFKELVGEARFVIRTGEATPYANVILVGGVNF